MGTEECAGSIAPYINPQVSRFILGGTGTGRGWTEGGLEVRRGYFGWGRMK